MYAIGNKITSKAIYSLLISLLLLSNVQAEESTSGLGTENPGGQSEPAAEGDATQQTENSMPLLYQQELAFDQKLASESKEEEVVWLEIKYPGAATPRQSLALQIKPKSVVTHGAALIIPDTQEHANWPGLVRTLRETLSYEGWQTLAINLPWPGMENVPPRDLQEKGFETFISKPTITEATALGARAYGEQEANVSETPSESTTEIENDSVDIDLKQENNSIASLPPYHERALVHVQQGLDYLARQGFQNVVVIGLRESTDLVIDYVQSRESEITDKGFSIVLLEPTLSKNRDNEFAQALGERFPAPVLDIYDSSSQKQKEAARLRAASAKRGQLERYTQLKTSSPGETAVDNFMLRRLANWLELNAPGERKGY